MSYINLADTKEYLNITTTDDDDLITRQITEAELLINEALKIYSFENKDYEIITTYKSNGVYNFKSIPKINSVLSVNNNNILPSDSIVRNFSIKLLNNNEIFEDNDIKLKLNIGYTVIPEIVKYTAYNIVEMLYIYHKKNVLTTLDGGVSNIDLDKVSSFTQGDLSVSFQKASTTSTSTSNGGLTTLYKSINDIILMKLNRYIKKKKTNNKIYS